MTEILTKVVVDCSTGEQTTVELTNDEIAQLQADRAAAEAHRLEAQAKAEAKASAAAKLAALGLTADEIAALS